MVFSVLLSVFVSDTINSSAFSWSHSCSLSFLNEIHFLVSLLSDHSSSSAPLVRTLRTNDPSTLTLPLTLLFVRFYGDEILKLNHDTTTIWKHQKFFPCELKVTSS